MLAIFGVRDRMNIVMNMVRVGKHDVISRFRVRTH